MNKLLTKKVLIGICATALVLIVAFCLYCLSPFPVPFDSHEWRTCDYHSRRYAMHADLLQKHKLIGLGSVELVQLLGVPDVGHPERQDSRLEWDMGSVPAHDDNTLVVQMKDGKVAGYQVDSH